MPSAGPDPALVERFRRDLEKLLTEEELLLARPIGIALSGGPDSCALLLLAAAAFPGHVAAMTVDHGLRPAAADEARAAADLCASLGIPHEVSHVRVGARGGIQAAAREQRYGALGDWAGREAIMAVLTAHHADDQAETVLMRLARGAGPAGLAGIRAARPLAGNARLLRPLLGWRKAELEAIVGAAGVVPARDPSNHDPRYDRTAARALLAQADWLDPRRIAASAAYLAEAEQALDTIARTHAAKTIGEEGDDVTMRRTGIAEIDRRILRRLFADRFDAHPDGPMLERALTALARGRTASCADILCRADPPVWRFRRAPPRRPTGPVS